MWKLLLTRPRTLRRNHNFPAITCYLRCDSPKCSVTLVAVSNNNHIQGISRATLLISSFKTIERRKVFFSFWDVIWELIKCAIVTVLWRTYMNIWRCLTLPDASFGSQCLSLGVTHILWLSWGVQSHTWEFLIIFDFQRGLPRCSVACSYLLSSLGPVLLT